MINYPWLFVIGLLMMLIANSGGVWAKLERPKTSSERWGHRIAYGLFCGFGVYLMLWSFK